MKITKCYIGIGACCFMVALAGCSKVAEKPPVVVVDKPIFESVEIYGEYVGQLNAKKQVEVRARVDGFLEKMLFKEGTLVREGDVLFSIDASQYVAKVNKAKAQLEQAKAAASKADRDVQRLKPLYEQNAASQLDLDNAIAATNKERANVLMYEAELQQAELELSFTKVKSPLSGYVGERQVDIGTLVGAKGESLLTTVYQTDTVSVHFYMTALDYLKGKRRNVDLTNAGTDTLGKVIRSTVSVTKADRSPYPFSGFVDFANPQVDSKTGTFTLRADIPNPDRELLPGQFTRVKVLIDVIENAVLIPKKSIIVENGGVFVFVMRHDSVVEKRFIEIGEELNSKVVASRGLNAVEPIVIDGFQKLQHGMKILPVAPGDSIWMRKPNNKN